LNPVSRAIVPEFRSRSPGILLKHEYRVDRDANEQAKSEKGLEWNFEVKPSGIEKTQASPFYKFRGKALKDSLIHDAE